MRFILALILTTTAAHAEMKCAPSLDMVTQVLLNRYGEVPQSIAAFKDGLPFVVFANPATGTWTAIIVTSDGRACIPASGVHYAAVKPGAPA